MSTAFAFIDRREIEFYFELLDYLKQHFQEIQSGIQGDAWIWIFQDEQKVAIDTFDSMEFEIKSDRMNPLLQKVIEVLEKEYRVHVFNEPIERYPEEI